MTVKKIRNWKKTFFILLGSLLLLLAVMLGAFFYLVLSDPGIKQIEEEASETGNTYFKLTTNKAGVNSWIRDELSKSKKSIGNIKYEVVLDDYIYLNGNLLVFNRELPFQMIFDVNVNEDKGLTLKEKEVSIGKLNLPGDIVLGLLNEQFELPVWAEIHPMDHEIIVDLREIKLQNGMTVSAKKFDLQHDIIELELKR